MKLGPNVGPCSLLDKKIYWLILFSPLPPLNKFLSAHLHNSVWNTQLDFDPVRFCTLIESQGHSCGGAQTMTLQNK